MLLLQPLNDATDVLSISGQVLAGRLRFVQEVSPLRIPCCACVFVLFLVLRSVSETGGVPGYVDQGQMG